MTTKKTFSIILLAFFIVNLVSAQEKSQAAYDLFERIPAEVEDQLFRVDFLYPGFQYEKGLSEDATIQAAVYLYFIVPVVTPNNVGVDFGIVPRIEVSYRYYYNLHKRKDKYKNFTNNSGQYIAPKLSLNYLFSPTNNFNSYSDLKIGGVWGFQKNGDPITFNFEIGVGYGPQNTDYTDPTLEDIKILNISGIGKLTVGFLVGKRNRAYKKYKQDSF